MEQRYETRLRYQSEQSMLRGWSLMDRKVNFQSQNPDLDWLKGMQPKKGTMQFEVCL